MPEVVDQLNRTIQVPDKVESIISLVPSQTELLFYLGLEQNVKGVTKFCLHPNEAKTTSKIIGGTKSIHLDRIDQIKPDIIFANKEENTKEMIAALADKYPVWISDILTKYDALAMIQSVGKVLGKMQEADQLVALIKKSWKPIANKFKGKKVLYLIWQRPYMAVGNTTYINSVLNFVGLNNVVDAPRYPELSMEEMRSLQPDIVLLSSEPYPFKEKHIASIQNLMPEALIQLVDGEMFSWYGPRMLRAAEYFDQLTFDIKS